MLGLSVKDLTDYNYALINQVARLVFALIFFPLALYSLDITELNLWLLMMSVLSFGQSLVYGPAITIVRYLSYTESGIDYSMFNSIDKVIPQAKYEVNIPQRASLIRVAKGIFGILSLCFLGVWLVSYIVFFSDIVEVKGSNSLNLSLLAACLLSTASLYFQSYQSILEGTGDIVIVQKISAFSHVIGSIVALLFNTTGHTLLSLVLIHQLIILLNFLFMRCFLRFRNIYIWTKTSFSDDLYLYKLILGKAKLSSYTSVLSGAIKHFSALVLSSFFTGVVLSNFLLTKRLFEIIETFSSALFLVKSPSLIRKYAAKIYGEYLRTLKTASYASLGLYIVASVGLMIFGVEFVNLFAAEPYSPGSELLIVFFIAGFGARLNALFLSICNHSNNVIEHKAISIYLVAFLITIAPLFWLVGIYSVPAAAIIGSIINLPYVISNAKVKTLNAII